MAGFTKDNQPVRPGTADEVIIIGPRRRSRLLGGGANARAIGEAVLVAAFLAVLAFWQGDFVSEKIGMYLDDGKVWPVDGVLAALLGVWVALTKSKKIRAIDKIRYSVPLMVYGANSIYTARVAAGATV